MISFLNWVHTNGGWIASITGVVMAFNVLMAGIQKICNILKIQEPSKLQKAAVVGSAVSGVLSANVPTVPNPVKPPES